jgi:RimJ/RimL family protein N-acetyltransferase
VGTRRPLGRKIGFQNYLACQIRRRVSHSVGRYANLENKTNMHAFPVNDPVLQELFDPNQPNSSALWAVLLGNYSGKAVVDNVQIPSQCVLRTDAQLTYFSNQTSQAFLDEAIAHFRESGSIWLVWPHSTSLHPPENKSRNILDRLEFYGFDPQSEILAKLRRRLPVGYDIRMIDNQLLERCEWRAEIEFFAGSMSNFLLHGIGLCMMKDDEIIVEAYAFSLGKPWAEIGAITHKEYWGQGYAPIACAYLIEVCEERGYQAYWSCDTDNPASIRVAQKLGFLQENAYRVFEYNSFSCSLEKPLMGELNSDH